MRRPSRLELGPRTRTQRRHFPSPAQPIATPSLYTLIHPFRLPNYLSQLLHIRAHISRPLPKRARNLLLLLSVRRESIHRQRVPPEEIRHQNKRIEGMRQQVGALEGLGDEAEDIVDGDEGASGVGWANRICV